MASAYRLIGIDLDGTLLDERGHVSDVNRQAIARAQAAGIHIVPCTGRGWREATFALGQLDNLDVGVFITGAVVADVHTGESHDFAVIEPHLAAELVAFLADQPEAVLVYREHNRAGHEYLVTGAGELTENTRWWFKMTGAKLHEQKTVTSDDLHHTLRVGLVASARRVPPLTDAVAQRFGDRVLVHSFAALKNDDADQEVHVLEIFAAGVDKWRGLSWIARQHDICVGQIATIGDQINDLSMLRAAGCGIAMGNGIEQAKDHADRITHTNDENGVAHAIDQLIAGRW